MHTKWCTSQSVNDELHISKLRIQVFISYLYSFVVHACVIDGDMLLRIIQNNKVEEINISEGEIFLLPKMIPHSPQRFKDTVGLVIERKRNHGELDGFQWYCDNCNYLLHETFFKLENISREYLL